MNNNPPLPTLEHAGLLDDLTHMPGHVMADHRDDKPHTGLYSCSYCGVGGQRCLQARRGGP